VTGWFVAAGLLLLWILTVAAWLIREIGWWQFALEAKLRRGEQE
jgi:hypothetical protein